VTELERSLASRAKALESDAQQKDAEIQQVRQEWDEENTVLRMQLTDTVMEAEKRMRELQDELSEANHRTAAAECRVSELADQVPEATAPLLRQISELEEVVDRLRDRNMQLETGESEKASAVGELRRAVEEKEAEVAGLSQQVSDLRSNYTRDVQRAKGEAATLAEDCAEKATQAAQLSETVKDLKGRLRDAMQEIDACKKEHAAALDRARRQQPLGADQLLTSPVRTEDGHSADRRDRSSPLGNGTGSNEPNAAALDASVVSTPTSVSLVRESMPVGGPFDRTPGTPPGFDPPAGRSQQVLAELHRYVVENAELKKTTVKMNALQFDDEGSRIKERACDDGRMALVNKSVHMSTPVKLDTTDM
ncbi:hypothetical protein DIPPA_31451, partial [Diplonema papillatum]